MASKEQRSLMAMGGSLVVSLPWSWLNYHNVKAGDKVEVITGGKIAKIKLLNDGREIDEGNGEDTICADSKY